MRHLFLTMFLLLTVLGCARVSTATYTDPFEYCAAVGTIDKPDKRYTGEPIPQSIANGLRDAFGLSPTASAAPFRRNTYWRCMGGKVYACNVGANLPCQTKADISKVPSAAMADFCKASARADVIPAYVTGRATVYTWRCTDGRPAIIRQVAEPDAQGYLSNIWYEITQRR